MTRQYLLPHKIELSRGQRAVVQVQEKSIALFNVDGTIYAIDDSCPHAGSSLASGKLDGRTVQCPAHGLRFDLATGCMRYGAGLAVHSYPVTLDDGALVITLPKMDAMGARQ